MNNPTNCPESIRIIKMHAGYRNDAVTYIDILLVQARFFELIRCTIARESALIDEALRQSSSLRRASIAGRIVRHATIPRHAQIEAP